MDTEALADAIADRLKERLVPVETLSAVCEAIEKDSHRFGTRGCKTCAYVTSVIGRPFGCDKVRAERQATP